MNIRGVLFSTFLAASGGLAFAGTASAASILVDQGYQTYDPNTKLEWLDITFTSNHSYDEIAAGYNGYTTTKGWHFATAAQLAQLITDAGGGGTYPQHEDTAGTANGTYDVARALTQLIGANDVFDNGVNSVSIAQGYVADTFAPGLNFYGSVTAQLIGGTYTGDLNPEVNFYFTNRTEATMGSFLVRTTPIPATLPLLMTALAAFGFAAWRRRAGTA